MSIMEKNKNLYGLNTFGMSAVADYYVRATSEDDVMRAIELSCEKKLPLLVLSGGSNMLIVEDLHAVVLHMDTRGIEVEGRDGSDTLVRVAAGEDWHETVMWSIENGYAGMENLAYIPGKVGSSPVQNIGAYGVEARCVIESVEVIDISSGERRVIAASECEFGYRESIFKNSARGRYVIMSVLFRLHSTEGYKLHLDYGNIRAELEKRGIENPTVADVADVVTFIRRSKLPEPSQVGNCGSFFKNPVISRQLYETLIEKHNDMPSYDVEGACDEHWKKIPAAYLIDRAGWKGYRRGSVGVHQNQALVLVHYGGGTGKDVLMLCQDICRDVKEKYGVEISPEVNIINSDFLARCAVGGKVE